jgi:hypothetical protein
VFSKVMRAGRARALVFALVIMVAALIASLLALAAATKPAEAAFPGTNGKIAFDRSFRIWVKNPSLGAEETKLRDDVLSDSYAAYSPDGSRVAFRRSPPPRSTSPTPTARGSPGGSQTTLWWMVIPSGRPMAPGSPSRGQPRSGR